MAESTQFAKSVSAPARNRCVQPKKKHLVQKRCEILKSLPVYGELYIPISEDNEPFYSEGFVVRFFKKDGKNWDANFKLGWTGFNAVYEFNNEDFILVIAGGTGYLINPESTKPINVFGVGFLSAIKSENNKIILQDITDLTIVEPNGEKWHTERIYWDGIKDLKLEGNIVSGLSFDPINDRDEWVEFIVNLENRNVQGGSYRQYEIKSIERKNKWWKFW